MRVTDPPGTVIIRGARIIDPASALDATGTVVVEEGHIREISLGEPGRSDRGNSAPASDNRPARDIDATGMILCPGLIDMHVHLREPGFEHKETIETGSRAAAAGGFTFVACMPNTNPAIDSVEIVRRIIRRSRAAGLCEVGPVAAITVNREGRVVTDFGALKAAGAVAFSDDGTGVEDDAVMLEAFERARDVDAVLIQHCEFRALSAGGVMHAGEVSRRLGLPGLDPRSEEDMIERDIELCRRTRGRYHVAHISTARAVELVRRAKAEGLPVTAEVTPHHLLLTDEACAGLDPNTKMHPPLRPAADVEACRRGLLDGTIDCVATDHAPHTAEEKGAHSVYAAHTTTEPGRIAAHPTSAERSTHERTAAFVKAPPGLIGLETAVALTARAMIETGLADWRDLVRWFTTAPARVLKLQHGSRVSEHPDPTRHLAREAESSRACSQTGAAGAFLVGAIANLTLIDPQRPWQVGLDTLHSKSRNTPFMSWQLSARPMLTIRGTRLIERAR
ncbi:MAG: dihydroorotase [Phycisphaerales bacterium]|nr:dihydroorotase [Phycisphaerales bacterium]